jgi:hypothetical protein
MKTGKLKKFETVAAPGIITDTPEELAALIAELLLIAERMPIEKMSAENVTKHNSGDAEKMSAENVTKINSGDDTGTFSNEQLLILEQIQNGE